MPTRNDMRILALPSTEDPSSPLNHRRKLSDEYLEKALKVVGDTLESLDEALAYKAAQWIAEMVMGKPKQTIEDEGGTEAAMAKALGAALAEWHISKALSPTMEGEVRVLGSPTAPDDTPIDAEFTESVNNSPSTNRSSEWDTFPEDSGS